MYWKEAKFSRYPETTTKNHNIERNTSGRKEYEKKEKKNCPVSRRNAYEYRRDRLYVCRVLYGL